MNAKELELEADRQLAVMLKGAAQYTDEGEIRERILASLKENRPLRIKFGLDPSAPDIHLGHAVPLRKIRQLQDMGHLAVIVIGDYTGMIGDPTGRSKTRKQLSPEQVKENAETYMEQIFRIIDREKTEVVFNSEWLSKMSFGDVIELTSKCTVARIMERDDFTNRFTNHLPLSLHEFLYPLMQAYDSVAVHADIELGGTDQTFNILLGRNIQRDYGQTPQLTLFMPLLEGIDGVEKMSKSLGNYVGISEPPSVIFEKVMKIPDNMIIKYFDLCTDLHPSETDEMKKLLDSGENPRNVKLRLAFEITALYSGAESARAAQERFVNVFSNKQNDSEAAVLDLSGCPEADCPERLISELVEKGFFKSKSEIRRLLAQGGVQLGEEKISSFDRLSFFAGSENYLKIGKNKFFKVTVSADA